jgi:hypothetical protein
MIKLSDDIEKSINNRKIRDIVEIYIRKVYNKDIYEYFNINRTEYEKSFDIIFPDVRINEFLKKEKLKLDYKEIAENIVKKTSSLEYRLGESKVISDYILNIISKKKDDSEYSNISNLLLQMSLSKYISIIELTKGIKFRDKTIVEPFSIFPILRSIYETYSIFNNIFIKPENDDQIEYKYLLFKLSSLNYRQKFPAKSQENLIKKNNESFEIDNIKNLIRNNSIYISRNSVLLNKTYCDKGGNIKKYTIKKSEDILFDKKNSNVCNKGISKNYSELIEQSGINNSKLFEEKYNYLSMLSHPSYIGCLQFGETFSNKTENEYINTILLISNAIMSGFINDYKSYHKIQDNNINNVNDNLKLFYGI